jgi:hypothetical protein
MVLDHTYEHSWLQLVQRRTTEFKVMVLDHTYSWLQANQCMHSKSISMPPATKLRLQKHTCKHRTHGAGAAAVTTAIPNSSRHYPVSECSVDRFSVLFSGKRVVGTVHRQQNSLVVAVDVSLGGANSVCQPPQVHPHRVPVRESTHHNLIVMNSRTDVCVSV